MPSTIERTDLREPDSQDIAADALTFEHSDHSTTTASTGSPVLSARRRRPRARVCMMMPSCLHKIICHGRQFLFMVVECLVDVIVLQAAISAHVEMMMEQQGGRRRR